MSPDTGAATAAITDAPKQPATEQFADVVGFIDSIGGARIGGWVWNRQNPGEKVEVEIRLDNQPVETVLADRPRQDLEKAGIGDGAHGFEAHLPEQLSKEDRHRVSAIVHMPGIGGEIKLKNQAAVNTDALALRPSDFAALVGHLEQCVDDQRAGFRWIYHELHALDEFVRSDAQTLPAIAAAQTPIAGDDVTDAICAIESQFSEMVQNQTVIQESLEVMTTLQKTLDQRLEKLDVFNARIDARLEGLQRAQDEEPAVSDDQRGLKRLVLFLGCLTVASLVTGIIALVT
ncbi:MAG: hypothetical protein O3A51_09900 [Verrucomicrobia bacterium]|nr:hypothetical protein [Verrucomicrobiota bacterium]